MEKENNPADEIFKEHRQRIDALDEQIVSALAERFDIVREVGNIKAEKNIPVVQSVRAESVKQRAARLAEEKGLDATLVRHIYTLMIDHAHVIENDLK